MTKLCYLYAIMRPRGGRAMQLPAQSVWPSCPPQLLCQGELCAALSLVPAELFGQPQLDAQLADAAWVQARAVAHQEVLAGLCQSFTVAPLSFCTLLHAQSDVHELLGAQAGRWNSLLDRLEGSSEMGIKVYCERAQFQRWAADEAPPLEALRQEIANASAGAGFFLRKKLAQAAAGLADELLAAIIADCRRQFLGLARAEALSPLRTRAMHGRADDMLLHAAYLVPDAAQDALEATLATLRARHATQGLSFELSGPWPAYHFVGDEALSERQQA